MDVMPKTIELTFVNRKIMRIANWIFAYIRLILRFKIQRVLVFLL